MRSWWRRLFGRLNRLEAHAVRRRLPLSTDQPPAGVTGVSALAYGGGLWLAIAAVMAARPGRLRQCARDGAVAVVLASATAHLLSRLLPRQRPAADQLPAYQALLRKPTSPSFPSSHTSVAIAFTTALARRSRWVGFGIAPLALAVAYSRIRTWAHWPSDVVFGALLGVVVGEAAHRLPETLTTSLPPRSSSS
ncbi:phosphatase PAP2 family protein [Pseudonocardia sp. DSM 110487]|uniref:phosphatase PAP2 family protein n=1 Tax=Pseudonocardia sp. DSM 110487 TaxID=2865833 RepID=UPI001C6A5794|nr:phosphatase PAP2 family protein [Pseudonocardia sp. DSM 110487]QYN38943.1 phosphatase PAP2 family protein [Pseudonocardia sp. DSM 110487]